MKNGFPAGSLDSQLVLGYHFRMEKIAFPEGFTWGAASAAYQVEGSPLADGSGPSNWNEFSHRRGAVKDGTNGDVACDHWHLWADDVRLMRDLGLRAYRFSVGWARIFPEPGRLNQKGLDFYDRLVDALLAAGIQPWLTIFHLEEPAWLARTGGFSRRGAVDHLVRLGTVLFDKLGDRVYNWITINEPTIYSFQGHATGEFPPGKKLDLYGMARTVHFLLLAHSRLCDAWSASGGKGWIGLAHHALAVAPARPERARDREASGRMDDLANRWVLDAILRGRYPETVVRSFRLFLPRRLAQDLAEMKKPGTYVGINYYTRNHYRFAPFVPLLRSREYVVPGSRRSAMWEIHPPGLHATLARLRDEYGNPPCFITENGYPLVEEAGREILDDRERIQYLAEHVAVVGRAIAEGCDCRGYFHWSLMDNFEWSLGLRMRFGLLRTDFQTQERKWKKSAAWYRDLIRANGLQAPPEESAVAPTARAKE
jgi:beta-glucosidase